MSRLIEDNLEEIRRLCRLRQDFDSQHSDVDVLMLVESEYL